jgi:hypothetical protein
LPALDPGGDVDGAAGLPQRGFLLSALMRTMAVIVPRVLCKHPSQVLLTEDQHVVKELTAQGADEPLADCVTPGSHGLARLRVAGELGEDR